MVSILTVSLSEASVAVYVTSSGLRQKKRWIHVQSRLAIGLFQITSMIRISAPPHLTHDVVSFSILPFVSNTFALLMTQLEDLVLHTGCFESAVVQSSAATPFHPIQSLVLSVILLLYARGRGALVLVSSLLTSFRVQPALLASAHLK